MTSTKPMLAEKLYAEYHTSRRMAAKCANTMRTILNPYMRKLWRVVVWQDTEGDEPRPWRWKLEYSLGHGIALVPTGKSCYCTGWDIEPVKALWSPNPRIAVIVLMQARIDELTAQLCYTCDMIKDLGYQVHFYGVSEAPIVGEERDL